MGLRRRRIFEILDLANDDDRASRYCDVALIGLIALNVTATVFESIPGIGTDYVSFFYVFEVLSVAVFSGEYLVRLWSCVESDEVRYQHPVAGRLRYAASLMAVIDLLAVLPFFLAAFFPIDLRFLRVLRILRIFKLSHYFSALSVMLEVVRVERHAFGAAFFLLWIGLLFAASGIYLFEHEVQPVAFGSIPAAMWWAVATLTTVGYGDVTPVTAAGKIFGASITILGIGMVALPTGILATGFADVLGRRRRIFGAEIRTALADGEIDAAEQAHLDELQQRLGLSEEDVEALTSERRGAVAIQLEKCPHCGEGLALDPPLASAQVD